MLAVVRASYGNLSRCLLKRQMQNTYLIGYISTNKIPPHNYILKHWRQLFKEFYTLHHIWLWIRTRSILFDVPSFSKRNARVVTSVQTDTILASHKTADVALLIFVNHTFVARTPCRCWHLALQHSMCATIVFCNCEMCQYATMRALQCSITDYVPQRQWLPTATLPHNAKGQPKKDFLVFIIRCIFLCLCLYAVVD